MLCRAYLSKGTALEVQVHRRRPVGDDVNSLRFAATLSESLASAGALLREFGRSNHFILPYYLKKKPMAFQGKSEALWSGTT